MVLYYVLICAVLALTFAEEDNQSFEFDPAVKIGNAENFDKFIADAVGPAIVMFYAPWCGHCASAKKPFGEAASEHPDSTFVAINCEEQENHDFCGEHDIEGYPTFKIYNDGEFVRQFKGDRSKNNFKKIITDDKKAEKKEEKKEAKEEDTAKEADKAKDEDKTKVEDKVKKADKAKDEDKAEEKKKEKKTEKKKSDKKKADDEL